VVEQTQDERDGQRDGMSWEDGVSYALVLAGIYLLVGVLFFYAGKEKLFDGGGAPPPIAKQFSGTFLDTFPGIDATWTILGILEFAVFVLLVVSLATLEFLPGKSKPFLFVGLGLAVFTFAILAMGQNITGQNSGVASLYVYAAGTGVLIFLLRLMPPYGSGRWISSRRT